MTRAPFFVQTTAPASAEYVYFSYTTLATVGYGDFTAATSLGRMLVGLRGLVGQLYLVSAVALLVGNIGRSSARPRMTAIARRGRREPGRHVGRRSRVRASR